MVTQSIQEMQKYSKCTGYRGHEKAHETSFDDVVNIAIVRAPHVPSASGAGESA